MANAHDSVIVERFGTLEHRDMLAFLLAHGAAIHDDACYWCLVATGWIAGGVLQEADAWVTLFTAARRRRWKLMKGHDRAVWRRLPSQVRAWRAAADAEPNRPLTSYTLDRTVAMRFAAAWDRQVIEALVPRPSIVAYFDRRGEREIVVLSRCPSATACR